jgi:predicted  nucleic acid-binding Zn-ribbon protein
MVEERLARDKERLNQTSSPKDAQAIQSEIESLTLRKEGLEEVELEILERLEVAKQEIQVDELKSQGRKLVADKETLTSKVPADILEKYKALATKQVAVGKIESRSCTACHMGLTANTIDALADLPEDEIGSCPECLAMIVR